MRHYLLFLAAGGVLFLACSAPKQGSGERPPSSRESISYEEIQNTAASNAYQLIQNLRPYWLRGRGRKSFHLDQASSPVVYLDGTRFGGVESLTSIPVSNLLEIRFFTASEANVRLGADHPSGAIMIVTH